MGKLQFQAWMLLLFLLLFLGIIAGGAGWYITQADENGSIRTDPQRVFLLLTMFTLAGVAIALVAWNMGQRQRDHASQTRSLLQNQVEKQKTEAEYRLLFENSQEGILLGDAEGRIYSANPSACMMLWRTEAELRSLGWKSFLDAPDQIPLQSLKGNQHTQEYAGEVEIIHSDGSRFPAELYARAYVDDAGNERLGLFFRDLTARKQSEQAQRFSEERFRSIFENSTAGVALVDLEGRYQMVNPAFCKIFGYTEKELLEIDFYTITHPEDVDISGKIMDEVLARKGEVVHYTKRYIHRDGHVLWTEVNSVLVYSLNGQPLFFITHINDITERKKTEDALRESEERFRSLYENAAIGIYRTTPSGQIMMVNPAAVRILGYDSAEELEKVNLEIDKYLPEYPRSAFREWLEREGAVTGMESRWMRKNGTFIDVRESARVIRGPDGKVLYYDGTFEDISEQKRAEQEVQRRTEQLTALHTIDISIVSNVSLPAILETLIDQCITHLKVDATAVLLLDPATQALVYSASRGFRTDWIEVMRRATWLEDDVWGRPASLPREDITQTRLPAGEGFVFSYRMPLLSKGKVNGVMDVYRRSAFEPDQEWLDFFESLATQAVIAIDNTRLIDDLQTMNARLIRAYNDTLEGWSRALDLRDKETEGHSQRVIRMTLQIARAMGIEEAKMQYLRWGALLHDIGKIGIPDQILFKASRLSDEEMAIMKQHPEIAYTMLASIQFLLPAIDIPYCHHEKWDGTGYPRGLERNQIPLPARIFAIADVWDALRSDRPYRKAWTEEEACRYIHDQSGKHFDPQVVEVFERLMAEGKLFE